MAEGTVDNVAKIKVKFEADKESLAKIKDNWKDFSEEVAKVKNTGSQPTFVNMKNEIIELNQLFKEFNVTVGNIPKGNITATVEEMKKANNVISQQIQKGNKSDKNGVFKNYQSELSKLEDKAAKLNYQIRRTLDPKEKNKLAEDLARIKYQYRELNNESANFRKEIGIQWSRGFYDLNRSLDYFRAKVRSKFTMMSAERMMDFAFTAPGELVESLSKLEQAKVNFAQVMPDDFSNNQKAMNEAMREFIQVASDYGAEVDKVTEAGRLWGRQYKDVGIVQELVRNSTKLSITDNMSLVDVNKALEATMQQYGIRLKDANEAQEVSGAIVDKWSHLADTAVVTAADLATANEQSAGAAHQAGLSFDFLQGIIATMATRTGKSGAEVGRSIRSMLVSMNTAKARKEFQALGIALETVDNNGVKHLRNMEEVIVELMQKLRDSNKDIRDTVLAMSGGRFQYNNVLAFLTAYDEFQKNLDLSKSSAGWANQQVALQYETIDKQLVALKADLQGFIQAISEAGATSGIRELIGYLRSMVQVLQHIDPENIKNLGLALKNLVMFRVGLKAVSVALDLIPTQAIKVGDVFSGVTSQIAAATTVFQKLSVAITLLSRALGVIGLVFTVLQIGMTIYDAYNSKQEDIVKSSKEHAEKLDAEIGKLKTKHDTLEKLSEKLDQEQEIMKNSVAGSKEYTQAESNSIQIKQQIIELLDEEGKAKVLQADFAKKAIREEIDTLAKMSNAYQIDKENYFKAQEEKTEKLISEFTTRLKLYEEEAKVLGDMIGSVSGLRNSIPGFLAGRADMVIEESTDAIQSELDNTNSRIQGVKKNLIDAKAALFKARADHEKSKGSGSINGGANVDREPNEKSPGGSTGSGSGGNYAAKANLLQYQKQKNELWYDGKIAAQQYSNELKRLNDTEELSGITAEISGNRLKLHNDRVKELTEYKEKLVAFRTELEKALDQKMTEAPELAKELGYIADLTTDEKIRIMEVNKETFQEMKSFTEISKMISEVNSKLEDTESKLIDVNKAVAKTKLSMKPEDIYSRVSTDLKTQYESGVAERSGYNNTFYDYQNKIAQIQYLSDLYVAQMERVNAQRSNLFHNFTMWDEKERYSQQEKLKQWELEAKQTMANIRQAKLDSTEDIREGLADVTTQLLFEGNSWKDIWKKLWQDLAKDAILSLLKVQHQASLLGLVLQALGLFGGFKGGSVGVSADGYSPSSFVSNFTGGSVSDIAIAHTGGIMNAYPKMHSGGDVSGGRTGVVPKLRNDEVLRTLQVGEEVNSLADRRSNEILGAVAMKALDTKNEMPGNIQIFAMDSKSFAEYLNENAEILLGVLAKHKALGR